MKKLSILQWVLIGLAVAVTIAAVVCYFVAPKFTFAISGLLIGGLAGFIGGYYVAKNSCKNDE